MRANKGNRKFEFVVQIQILYGLIYIFCKKMEITVCESASPGGTFIELDSNLPTLVHFYVIRLTLFTNF